MKTEAAILVGQGQPLAMAEPGIPALKPGQVLVEIGYSGACGTRVVEWRGDKGTGTVVDAGAGVTKVKTGDAVVLSWIRGRGAETGGCRYDWDGQEVYAGGVTTFQRHAVVSENRLTKMPEAVSPDIAILPGCAAPTGMGAVFNVLKVSPGDSIAVFGAGGIGLNACMAAAFAGAMPVIGIDPNLSRREFALACGATHVIDPSNVDVVDAVRAIVPGGVDLAVEASGQPSEMGAAIDAVRAQGGRAVVIGNAKLGEDLTLNPAVFNQGKSLLGTWGGDTVPDRDQPRYSKLLASGRFPLPDPLSAPYRLDQATEALEDLAAGRVGRPLIDMSGR